MTKLEEFFNSAKKEFGFEKSHEDFEQITALPKGFSSSCWHNSECPSLSYDEKNETKDGDYIVCDIFISSKNKEFRTYDEEHQFNIHIDGGGEGYCYEYASNSWQDIIDHAEQVKDIIDELIRVANEKDMEIAFKETSEMAKETGFSFR